MCRGFRYRQVHINGSVQAVVRVSGQLGEGINKSHELSNRQVGILCNFLKVTLHKLCNLQILYCGWVLQFPNWAFNWVETFCWWLYALFT